MKTRYWVVMSELYQNGTVKAAITSRMSKAKPNNTARKLPFADCRMDWFDRREDAEKRLREARLGGLARVRRYGLEAAQDRKGA
jgi:hypothetical protein